MGKKDTIAKEYLGAPERFAAFFNYLLYDGEQVIKPDSLTPIDPNERIVIRQDKRRLPLQRTRDLLNSWAAYEDDNVVYVLLGEELQDKVHYAMPVKNNLYDGIDYAAQVIEYRRKYRSGDSDVPIEYSKDYVKIRLNSAEFLSGLRKGDKLKPIITATIYLGEGDWDGPEDLHDMLYFPDERLKQFVPNYKLNLIVPTRIPEEDFAKFDETDLGFFLRVLKHQERGAAGILNDPKYESVKAEAANAANEIANLGLRIEPDEKGDVDMCKSMREHDKETEVKSACKMAKSFLKDDSKVIVAVAEQCDVTPEYVGKIMSMYSSEAVPSIS